MLEVRDLRVRFGGLAAVNGVSFEIPPRSIVAVIGPNGAGKTTMLNAISGFQRVAGGDVRLEGRVITGLAPERLAGLGVSRTFQQTRLFGGVTVRESLRIAQHLSVPHSLPGVFFGTARLRKAEHVIAERAERVLARVGLTSRAEERAASLPYGDQRLLGIAVALCVHPRLLLLDEPTVGMNQREKQAMVALLADLRAEGTTILLVEHDMRVVMELSDRVVVLHHGQKIADNTPLAVRTDAAVIEAYLGGGFSHA
jgi:branched-chain amino acid transport system ATP-binding protein